MISALKIDDEIQLIGPSTVFTDSMFDLINSNRAYLDRHITFAQNKNNIEQVEAFLKEIESFNIGGQKFNMLIEYLGDLVGIIGFHRIDRINAKAEIGYWIAEYMQGKGIVTKLMPTFLHYGFEGLAVNRVDLLTLTTQEKSIALAERNGFIKEGILKEYYFMHNTFHDAILYRMLKSEFLNR